MWGTAWPAAAVQSPDQGAVAGTGEAQGKKERERGEDQEEEEEEVENYENNACAKKIFACNSNGGCEFTTPLISQSTAPGAGQ
jgi:hypothetical protein